ncbi:EpsD family peptidyl-prolyl cis-trans isomerase [Piscinibacter sakaiensis]|uniref:EpsD family peptidyl-prolyl cis-trans isomerase n=1 Tax=Piscinibacter sakaiensis TaxID=1547922 RepID=UPI003AAD6AC3
MPTRHFPPSSISLAAMALAAPLLLTACGNKSADKPTATQTAARVNKSEITVHQINFVLQQQPGLRPEQLDEASKAALEGLIEQELAVQKAEDLKLDRDPQTVQMLEAARRQVLAKAYVDRAGAAAPKPTPEQINRYYADNPALFKERRVYTLQEIGIEAMPEHVPTLRTKLQAAATVPDFIDYLRTSGLRFAGNQVTRPAEQIPLAILEQVSKMKDGQAMLIPVKTGVQVIVMNASRSEPVDIERARPAIEQFLVADAKRKLVQDDLKAMRADAKIAYKGKFEAMAANGTEVAPVNPPAPTTPQASTTTTAPAAGTGMTSSDIAKGLKLK